MKNIVSVLFLYFFLSITALAQQTVNLSGTVSVESTGKVLHQASVKIPELGLTAITGDDGTYSFNVTPDRYTVIAH